MAKKAEKKVAKKSTKKVSKKAATKVEAPEPRQPGAVGFLGSVIAEGIMKQRLGTLAEDCTYDYVPHMEDIRKALTQFYRYDIIARHKDGDVVLQYKFQLDHNGRMIPDQVIDRVNIKLTQKGS